MPTLEQVSPSQASPEVPINENFDTLSIGAIFGKRQPVTSGLIWGYYGGLFNGNTIADGTVTLTNGSDNYVVVHRGTGVVSTSTTNTNSLNSSYAKLYKITCAGGVVTTVVDQRQDANGLLFAGASASTPVAIQIAVGDETTALTVGSAKVTFRVPYAFTLTDLRASVTTAPTGGTLLTVDVKKNGSSFMSTKLTFDATEKTTVTAATPRVITTSSVSDDDEITIDILNVGSTLAGAGLKVSMIGTKP
jgi:hypothetical protein